MTVPVGDARPGGDITDHVRIQPTDRCTSRFRTLIVGGYGMFGGGKSNTLAV
jgi:hypothetical protein